MYEPEVMNTYEQYFYTYSKIIQFFTLGYKIACTDGAPYAIIST